jgi:8-oxo-dGTP pyrophosphatase MutT (NUDIX family)
MPSSWLAPVAAYIASEPRFQPVSEIRLYISSPGGASDHNSAALAGWVSPAVAAALAALAPRQVRQEAAACHLRLQGGDYAARSRELQALAEALHARGLVPGWRAEAMALRDAAGQPWAAMERAAFRTLGLATVSAHLNAFVQTADGVCLWVATRSASKAVDPGRLDNLVGGGVTGLESIARTLQREAWEEAGLALPRPVRTLSRLHILRHSPHGVQDERVHVHDLWLRGTFHPENHDGELAAMACQPIPAVLEQLVAGRFTRDAALVILDGLCRQCCFGGDTPALTTLLEQGGFYA